MLESNGSDPQNIMIKDYGDRALGRTLASHEFRILKKLDGLEGVPRAIALSGRRLSMTRFDGTPIQDYHQPLPDHTYYRLEKLLLELHRRKIVHLDLRHRRNVIVSSSGEPFIVDFESALDLSKLGPLFDILSLLDKAGLLRIKKRYFPWLLSRQDTRFLRTFNMLRPFFFLRPFKLREQDIV
jgi:predicted Ser/Thr protein kinase